MRSTITSILISSILALNTLGDEDKPQFEMESFQSELGAYTERDYAEVMPNSGKTRVLTHSGEPIEDGLVTYLEFGDKRYFNKTFATPEEVVELLRLKRSLEFYGRRLGPALGRRPDYYDGFLMKSWNLHLQNEEQTTLLIVVCFFKPDGKSPRGWKLQSFHSWKSK